MSDDKRLATEMVELFERYDPTMGMVPAVVLARLALRGVSAGVSMLADMQEIGVLNAEVAGD